MLILRFVYIFLRLYDEVHTLLCYNIYGLLEVFLLFLFVYVPLDILF